MLEKGGV